jgi:transposase
VKELVGVTHVTIQRWVRWYEAGGLEEVARHRLGSGVRPYEAWMPAQEQRLWEAVSEGRFRTIGEAVAWCRRELGVAVWYKKLLRLVLALGLSEEGIAADGGESGCAGAGGVEKRRGYWQP